MSEAKQEFRIKVATYVGTVERRCFVPTKDMPASDGIAVLPTVGEKRLRIGLIISTILVRKRFEAFVDVPAAVLAAMNDVDLLAAILPYIGYPEIASEAVKTEKP